MMADPISEKRSRIPNWVKQVVPILVSVFILYHYFHDQDWEELLDVTGGAALWLAIPAVIAPQLSMWILNVLITGWSMVWFHGPFPFWKFFWMRGAIFILQMVNNPLATGGTLIYIQRKTGISWGKLLGIMGFRFQLSLWSFGLVMIPITLAMHYYGLDKDIDMNLWGWWGFLIFQVVFLAGSWFFWHHNFDVVGLGKLIVRDRESEFWTAFNQATKKQWLIMMGVVLPQIMILFSSYYFLARAFDINVPFLEFMVMMPLVLFISNLPIAFGGFGTTTLAWTTFFGDYGTAGKIGAISLFIPFGRAIFRAVVGLICLKPALSDITTLSLISPANEDEPGAESSGDGEEN